MEHIREAYQKATRSVVWRKGDVLMLDNMLPAHGRNQFVSDRRVLVGMSDPIELRES